MLVTRSNVRPADGTVKELGQIQYSPLQTSPQQVISNCLLGPCSASSLLLASCRLVGLTSAPSHEHVHLSDWCAHASVTTSPPDWLQMNFLSNTYSCQGCRRKKCLNQMFERGFFFLSFFLFLMNRFSSEQWMACYSYTVLALSLSS